MTRPPGVPRCLGHELIIQRRHMEQKTHQLMRKTRQVLAGVAVSTRIRKGAMSATCTLSHLQHTLSHTPICPLRHGPGALQKHPTAHRTVNQEAAHKGEETSAQASAEVNRKEGGAVARGYMGALLSLGTSPRQGNQQVRKHQVPRPWTRHALHRPHRCPLHPRPLHPHPPLRLRTLPPPPRRRPPRRGTRQPRSLMMENSFGIFMHIHAHWYIHTYTRT